MRVPHDVTLNGGAQALGVLGGKGDAKVTDFRVVKAEEGPR